MSDEPSGDSGELRRAISLPSAVWSTTCPATLPEHCETA